MVAGMNKELIIQMAREAGGLPDPMVFIGAYERFFQLATEWEREQCAKVCDDFERAKWESVKNISQNGGRLAFAGPMHCAAAIRARGETK